MEYQRVTHNCHPRSNTPYPKAYIFVYYCATGQTWQGEQVMKVSALEEYGLRCMLRLGRVGEGESLTNHEIAEQEGLSVANVRKLMIILREAGLVQSVRGRSGGYALSEPATNITLGRIMESLAGRMYDPEFCGKHSGEVTICVNSGACS